MKVQWQMIGNQAGLASSPWLGRCALEQVGFEAPQYAQYVQ